MVHCYDYRREDRSAKFQMNIMTRNLNVKTVLRFHAVTYCEIQENLEDMCLL